jgi:hypothetical protein
MTEGHKNDAQKPRWALVPYDAMAEIVKVLTSGAAKYEDRNFEAGINYDRCFSALMRHLTAWWQGETYDLETGYSHLAHAGCELLFLLTYEVRGMRSFDNRPHVGSEESKDVE